MSDFNRNELKNKTLGEFSSLRSGATPKMLNLHLHKNQETDEFGDTQEDVTGFFAKLKLILPILLVASACVLGYAWYTDKFAIGQNTSGELPIIRASKSQLREKPEDPGGMKIVNRDKKIYDAISGKDSDKIAKVENILPMPEEPLSREEVMNLGAIVPGAGGDGKLPQQDDKAHANDSDSSLEKPEAEAKKNNDKTTQIKNANTENIAASAMDNSVKSEEKFVSEKATLASLPDEKPHAKEPPPATQHKEEQKKIETTEKPRESVKAVTADDITDVLPGKTASSQKKATALPQGYRLQIGSYRSTGDAESSWKSVKNKFPDILSNLNDYIEKADLGDKGVYYRLQLYGFKSEVDARKVCQKLNSQKQGCFFVGK